MGSRAMKAFVKAWWGTLSKPIGTRNLGRLGRTLKSAYKDTVFYYSEDEYPAVKGYVALTIDDGICRQDCSQSMADDVLALLQEHDAKATFFLCSDYLKGACADSAKQMLAAGHEFGNHMPQDQEYMSLDQP